MILDGKLVRDERIKELKNKFSQLPVVPVLAIVQVGDRADSNAYINQKKLLAEKLGVKVWHLKFSAEIDPEEVKKEINNLNSDEEIRGIIVQLPLPDNFNKKEIINLIDPNKDVDGLSQINQDKFYNNKNVKFIPATARGVMTMLDFYNTPFSNQKAVVVGRSELVGKPIAELLRRRGCIVEVCHSHTPDVPAVTRTASILVVAVGKPKLISLAGTNNEQIIVDVGINKDDNGKMCGDVDFELIKDHVKAISPVPGGVGPLTVLSLFENLYSACV